MIGNALFNTILKLKKICGRYDVEIVFMGGLAASFYGRPRATYDIDGIIDIETERINNFLKVLQRYGLEYDKKSPVKFINKLPFITLFTKKYKLYIDLFIAKNKYQTAIIKRAKKIKLDNVFINIITPEDLILLKLQTGRERDTEDVRNILTENYKILDIGYLKKWAVSLGVNIFLNDELESLRVK